MNQKKSIAYTAGLGLGGGIAGFVTALAVVCFVLAIVEPGLESWVSIALRNFGWLLIGLTGLLATSRLGLRDGQVRHAIAWLVATSLSLIACGSAFVVQNAGQRESQWARLEALAGELRVLEGRSQLTLGDDRSLIIYRVQTSEGDRLRIVPVRPWLKSLFGLDPLQLDAVVVDLSPQGRVRQVRTDYF